MSKKKKVAVKKENQYNASSITAAEKYLEIRKILRGEYDNWESFGYSGGLCSGK